MSIDLAACGSGGSSGDDACLEPLSADCQPSFPATFDTLYEQVFAQRCGVAGDGNSCHGRNGLQGGLGLYDKQIAYDGLMGIGTSHARVVPYQPECSLLVKRVDSDDPNFRMPKGESPMPAGVRCAIQQWIAAGASQQ